MIVIEDKHIREAEKLLIGENRFDEEERVPFIKNLNSIDLLAVPGSGKTTALQAKLYCLSKHLPFADGSGILVLSHTNAAVYEIEKNLKRYCPKLFEYPNFVGTIQSFVNKFLANHGCYLKYGSYVRYNNDDLYKYEAEKFFNSLIWKSTTPKGLKNKLFGKLNIGKDELTFEEKIENIKTFFKNFELDIINRKVLYNNRSFYIFSGNSQDYYLKLEGWRESLFKKGLLNYKDSFHIGGWYINMYKEIIPILQKRFKFIFIDEMQDLEKFQIELIDTIFRSAPKRTIIQRIGDINQSIYNSGKKVKVIADWEPRSGFLCLTGSNRLTPEVADVVNYFTLDPQKNDRGEARFFVKGLKKLDEIIIPHLIMFDKNSMGGLEDEFRRLIKEFSLHETDEGIKFGFKIIGWNAKWEDEKDHKGKLRLENIFNKYKKDSSNPEKQHNTLSEYLQSYDRNVKTLIAARNRVLAALLAILRIEEKKLTTVRRGEDVDRYYTQREMIQDIKQLHSDQSGISPYELFKTKLYHWSFDLMAKQCFSGVYFSMKSFIENEFKEWFNLEIDDNTQNFIGDEFDLKPINEDTLENNSAIGDIPIDIGTVHSAKGQTHCATMYVETSYHDYETEKLKVKVMQKGKRRVLNNPLFKKEHEYRNAVDRRAKQTMKMMYVGFSRPTHLLCFACLKENVISDLEHFVEAGWKPIDLTNG